MDFSASAATKDAARLMRRRFCTPPRFFSTLPHRRLCRVQRVSARRDRAEEEARRQGGRELESTPKKKSAAKNKAAKESHGAGESAAFCSRNY